MLAKGFFLCVSAVERSRVCLTASETNSTGYVNASYVTVRAPFRSRLPGSAPANRCTVSLTSPVFPQGHHHCREFIVSQTPLSGTVADFWRMIWEHNTHTVVRLPDAHGQVINTNEITMKKMWKGGGIFFIVAFFVLSV